MATELTFCILTPRILLKARTGGILSRLIARTGLELVGAQMLAFDHEQSRDFGALVAQCGTEAAREICGNYIQVNFAPAAGGKNPVMMLLFQGEDAVARLNAVSGIWQETPVTALPGGMTIFDTFGDQIDGIYFEPGIISPSSVAEADRELAFLEKIAATSSNVIDGALGSKVSDERTLVIIKPENWYQPSSRPGAVFDLLAGAGLRVVGCKVLRMTVNMGLEFYGQVQAVLRKKLAPKIGSKALAKLETEFGLKLDDTVAQALTESVGFAYADDQFFQIVKFMSGRYPAECPESERDLPNAEAMSLVLIFEGADAIAKIRRVLGPTNPAEAPGGTVRGDYGTTIMINGAHASDAPESFERETRIIKIAENPLAGKIREYLATK